MSIDLRHLSDSIVSEKQHILGVIYAAAFLSAPFFELDNLKTPIAISRLPDVMSTAVEDTLNLVPDAQSYSRLHACNQSHVPG